MNQRGFSDEETDILNAVRRFVTDSVIPAVDRHEREKSYPDALVEQMKELGLFGIAVPAEFGGLGLRLPVFAAVMEELANGWSSLAAYVNSHSTVAYALATHGTPDQRARYLPGLASGLHRGALLLTEPHAGSDLKAIKTTVREDGGRLLISGQKIYVTNGARATLLLTLVKHERDRDSAKPPISLVILEKPAIGISVASEFRKMAFGLVDTVEILLENAPVPLENLLGDDPGLGFAQLMDALEVGRIAIAASAVGLASRALTEAKRFAMNRRTFGVPIDQHQAIQLRLAEMATQLVAARLITQEAAREKQSGGRADMITAMAKLFASEACHEITLAALRTHGGAGYITDSPIERLFRESPLYLVGEGTNDINKLVIARRMSNDAESNYLGLQP